MKECRERVTAEITLSHLVRLASEQGFHVSREEALAFLNQEGRAFEIWKLMMKAAEDFITRSLLRYCPFPGSTPQNCISPGAQCDRATMPCSICSCSLCRVTR